jgi:peptide/nickel transport system permease protein
VAWEYIAKRLFYMVLSLLLVSIIVFGITQVLPGNAAVMVLGEFAQPAQVAALEAQMGLNDPVHLQYWRWLSHLLSGDWGLSLLRPAPVMPMVLEALGRSLALGAIALTLVIVIAIPLGVLAAARRGKPSDLLVSIVSYVGVAVPEFVIGTLLLVFLARPELGWFPSGGFDPISKGIRPFFSHLILPAFSLAIIMTAHIARQTRSEMIDALQSDYVRTATLKGLPRRIVLMRHALRNALMPTITVIALNVGYLIGGILVVEEIFAYPGLGRLLLYALHSRDIPMIQASTMVLAMFYICANFAADLCYSLIDRRIQYG